MKTKTVYIFVKNKILSNGIRCVIFASQFLSLRTGVVESLKLLEFESEVTIQGSMSAVCECVSSAHQLGIEIDHRGRPSHELGTEIDHRGRPSHELGIEIDHRGRPSHELGTEIDHRGRPSHELGIEIDHRGAGLCEEVHNICQPLLCGN